ncbi:MAG: ABC-F family ATP-binding cassette domain-containing protein, partial [Microbacterium sp.]|nr:ABC-F family ATP-binding cassette domain-containing protein [Microbacterium sp.]
MGYIDVNGVSFVLPDGRPLLDEVTFRVGEGSTTALIGANGAGKTTLLRIVRGELAAHGGTIAIGGGLGVMDQFVGHADAGQTVQDLLVAVAPARVRDAARELEAAEDAIIERDDTDTQMRYAAALADYADAGGYEHETVWDACTTAALGIPYERARFRDLVTLSGGEQKRLALEALLRGPDEVLLLDEPDNYLDVPGKRWLEEQLRQSPKTVLLVSHDRELLARAADRIVTLEASPVGSSAWVHGGGFANYHQAREDRMSRLDELRRRWDEQYEKLRTLVATLKVKAANNDGFASRYRAAQTRLRKFEEAGPPEERPPAQDLSLRLRGARTGKRAIVAEGLELTGLMRPFDLEVWFGDRVAVLGSNGSGKSHFLRLLARGGTDPDATLGHVTATGAGLEPVAHTGRAVLGARVTPGWFAQTHRHPEFTGRTLLESLHRGDDVRTGLPRDAASSALDRYG